MGRTHGIRRGTRYMFARDFKKNGPLGLTTYLTNFKVGDIVDVKGNGAIQKGMPHKVYHGKTGRVFNVSRRAVGVEVNKRIKNRILCKRINVRIEHVKHSNCRLDFLKRSKANDQIKKSASEKGEKAPNMKRQAQQPLPAHFVSTKNNEVEEIRPIAFDFLF
eukprot:m.331289 g.331289  ORF g.331289 m.331289 type:complete len:162 (+) comp16693_c1_seq1:54-539(+)